MDPSRVPDFERRQVLLGDAPAHLDLAATPESKQWLAANRGSLANLGRTGQDDTIHWRTDVGAATARLHFGELCGRHLDACFCIGRCAAPPLDFFFRQRAAGCNALRTPGIRGREFGRRPRFFQ